MNKVIRRIFILISAVVMVLAFGICVNATDYGAWSNWQDSYVGSTATRQVETRQVPNTYTMESWVYTDSSSPNSRGYWPHEVSGLTLRAHHTETWTKEMVDTAWRVCNSGTYYNPGNTCDGLIHDGTAYVRVEGQGHDYVPFFITATQYKTQYRYRDAQETSKPSQIKGTSKITTGSITWTAPTQDCTGYKIEYSTSSNFNNAKTITVKGKNNCSCSLKSLKSNTTYYIRIRIYIIINGSTTYGNWSSTYSLKTMTTKGNLAAASFSKISNCTYNGKACKPSFKITINGVTLVKGTDYTVTYKNNTKVGTATIIIICKGKYCGKITKTFKILPKSMSISSLKKGSKKFTVKWKKRAKNCSGYQIRYCKSSSFKNCKYKTIKGYKKTSCSVSGLAAGTKYYVEIRIYVIVNGTKYYSKWSSAKSVSTKAPYKTRDGYIYWNTVKVGNYVYVCTSNYIWKVNIKTNKKSKFFSVSKDGFRVVDRLSVRNGYLYFMVHTAQWDDPERPAYLYRKALSGKTASKICRAGDYMIVDNKIYSRYTIHDSYNPDYDLQYYRSCDLDGSNLKTLDSRQGDTEYVLNYVRKYSNTTRYVLVTNGDKVYPAPYKAWLKKKSSGKKIYLGKFFSY